MSAETYAHARMIQRLLAAYAADRHIVRPRRKGPMTDDLRERIQALAEHLDNLADAAAMVDAELRKQAMIGARVGLEQSIRSAAGTAKYILSVEARLS